MAVKPAASDSNGCGHTPIVTVSLVWPSAFIAVMTCCVAGVSAAVLGREDELVGAVALSGLLTRFTKERVAAYREIVIEAANEIATRMGARQGKTVRDIDAGH